MNTVFVFVEIPNPDEANPETVRRVEITPTIFVTHPDKDSLTPGEVGDILGLAKGRYLQDLHHYEETERRIREDLHREGLKPEDDEFSLQLELRLTEERAVPFGPNSSLRIVLAERGFKPVKAQVSVFRAS